MLKLVQIPSGDGAMNTRVFLPSAAEKRGTLILFHGFPGLELNFDLAQSAVAVGWCVLIPHYRGAWGSPGTFSFSGMLVDAANVLHWARQPSPELGDGSTPVVIAGHSMGGFVTLMTAAGDDNVAAAASFATCDPGAIFANVDVSAGNLANELAAAWQNELLPLNVPDAARLADELIRSSTLWSLKRCVSYLNHRPMLLVGASGDRETSVDKHYWPLVQASQTAGATAHKYALLDADHSFSEQRPALCAAFTDWLKSLDLRAT